MAQVMREGDSTDPLLENVYPKLLGVTTHAQRPDLAASVRASVSACTPGRSGLGAAGHGGAA